MLPRKLPVLVGKRKEIVWMLIFFFLTGMAEAEEKFRPRLSLKFTAGFNYFTIGDMNQSLRSFNEMFDKWREESPEDRSLEGEIGELGNFLSDWEAEVRIDITPRFGLGLGTTKSLTMSNESLLVYALKGLSGDQVNTFRFQPEIKIKKPILLRGYYTFPSRSRVSVFLSGGIGYYWVKASQRRGEEVALGVEVQEKIIREEYFWETETRGAVGFQGGVGLEYRLWKNIRVVGEVAGRYLRVTNLKGKWEKTSIEEWDGYFFTPHEWEGSGPLYHYHFFDPRYGEYDALGIFQSQSALVNQGGENIRKAIIDLSGVSLRVGIRISK